LGQAKEGQDHRLRQPWGKPLAIPRLREDHRCREDIADYLKNVAEIIHPTSDLSTDSTGIQMHDGGGALNV